MRLLTALACVLAAGVVLVGPSAAFNAAQGITRSVSAEVVADPAAYNSVVVKQCNAARFSTSWCEIGDVYNKATVAQTFRLTEETDADKRVNAWRVGGGTSSSSGAASTPSTVAVGSSAALEAQTASCTLCSIGATYTVTWIVEGESPNRLNSIQTGIQVTIRYS